VPKNGWFWRKISKQSLNFQHPQYRVFEISSFWEVLSKMCRVKRKIATSCPLFHEFWVAILNSTMMLSFLFSPLSLVDQFRSIQNNQLKAFFSWKITSRKKWLINITACRSLFVLWESSWQSDSKVRVNTIVCNANTCTQLAPTRAQKHEFANWTLIKYFVKLVGRIEMSLSSIRLAESIRID